MDIDTRIIIQTSLEQRLSFKGISQKTRKDPTTISKEIRNHLKKERIGSVLLTVHFREIGLQLAFLRKANDSQSVIDVFERLYLELRPDVFMRLFPLLPCDNGSEFSNPRALEYDMQGNRRTTVYYCDPSAPYQKGSCENNHELIRRIIPKGTDIGKYTQEDIDLMMSHINSYSRSKHGDKSPYELFAFFYGEELLHQFRLRKIPYDKIILSPKLLNK